MGRRLGLPLACLALFGCAGEPPSPASPVSRPAIDLSASGPVEVAAAPGQSLHLARYEIAPMTDLRPHFHDGTQIGMILGGTMTYTVLTGSVPVYRHGQDGRPELVAEVSAGETRRITAGQWVVEHADAVHFGANREPVPLVIVTSSLLRAGAPLATPVEAQASPR